MMHLVDLLTPSGLGALLALATGSIFLYFLAGVFYNLYLHPLRSYPGPLHWRASRLPHDFRLYRGEVTDRILELHYQYGEVVRIAPNDLSYANEQVILDVFTHKPGREEFPKDQKRVQRTPKGLVSILGAEKDDHARYRRLLAHAFSEKGMQSQEPLIRKNVDLLIDRLQETTIQDNPINIVSWINMMVFDLIGDLAWGESFNSLTNRSPHTWIEAVGGNLKWVFQANIFRARGLEFLLPYVINSKTWELRRRNFGLAAEKVERRLQVPGGERGDFWDRVIVKSANNNEKGQGMSQDEMEVNSSVLALAGSETTATVLSGAFWFLCRNQDAMQKLNEEVRSTFKTTDEIELFSVNKLKYMLAVLDESMRLYTPVPVIAQRVPPGGGGMVCGKWLPEGTAISFCQIAAFQLPSNWHRADEFLPERFLDSAKQPDSEFHNDRRGCFQPFSAGTRNCIGRNLAYAEMRLILAKMLWHFDVDLDENKTGYWLKQTVYGARMKPPLWVRLREAKRE